jgi:hypothetical protein
MSGDAHMNAPESENVLLLNQKDVGPGIVRS